MIYTGLVLLAIASIATACNFTGTYVDRVGNIATLLVSPTGSIEARSFSGTKWHTAKGRVIDDTHLWLAFHPTDNETATLESNCSALVLPGAAPSVWGKVGDFLYGGKDTVVTDVHMVFLSHLDLGYTDLARNICDYYFQSNLPGNIALYDEMVNTSTPYALTSHAFLVSEFIDGAANCAHTRPTPQQISDFEAAIRGGKIRWHAQSANYNTALLNPFSFAAQVRESDALNAKYGQSWGSALMKSTDVPGLTRSVIPNLAKLGRKAVHTGGNGKCTLARVPQAFTWAHPESGTQVLALATNNYGGTLVIPPHALVINYQGDNSGAPSPVGVAASYAAAAAAFPGAKVKLSSFEEFVEAALTSTPGAAALPVITSEMGDSWLYGAGADPYKLAVFRETQRVVGEALAGTLPGQTSPLPPSDPNLLALQRRILVGGPEHNGGCSIGAYLPSCRGVNGDWDNAHFHANLASRSDYAFVQSSYDEKLNFTSQPLPPVGPMDPSWPLFLAERSRRVTTLTPSIPDVNAPGSGWEVVANPSAPTQCGRLTISLNPQDGSVASLVDKATGHDWAAGNGSSFLGFTYRTYTESDFNVFNAEYTPACGVPCENFAKDGLRSAAPESREWLPTLVAAYQRGASPSPCSLLLQLSLPSETMSKYGGMAGLWMQLDVDAAPEDPYPSVNATLSWVNKTATRMAEASFLSFTPNTQLSPTLAAARSGGRGSSNSSMVGSPRGWWMDVIGEPVDPLDVVPFGTRHLHAVGEGFGFWGGSTSPVVGGSNSSVTSFVVETLDAALVSPGDKEHLLFYDGNSLPDMGGGMHVNLHNNLWGTTAPQWWGGSMAFRFKVLLRV